MAMRILILLLFAALIISGNALKCYHCESDKENGCKVESNPEQIKCGIPIVNYQLVCAYKAFYEPNGNHYKIVSGCESIPNSSPKDSNNIHNCDDEKGIFNVKECRICGSDLCNSASLISSSLLVRIMLVILLNNKNVFL